MVNGNGTGIQEAKPGDLPAADDRPSRGARDLDHGWELRSAGGTTTLTELSFFLRRR